MTITTFAGLCAARRQQIQTRFTFGAGITALSRYSCWTTQGGTASAGNAANGLVPTKATAGALQFDDFAGSGFITRIEASVQTTPGRLYLYDRLFHAGAFTTVGPASLTSQPSYASRLVNGAYEGLEIFWEDIAAGNGGAVSGVNCTYTDQAGNAAAVSGAGAAGDTNATRNFYPLPFAAGDCGVQKIETVSAAGVAATGTYNIVVARLLWHHRFDQLAYPYTFTFEQIGLPQIFTDSCLFFVWRGEANTAPTFDIAIEIASD